MKLFSSILGFVYFLNFHVRTVFTDHFNKNDDSLIKPVKSQTFWSLNFLDKIKNEECRSDIKIFQEGLLLSHLWAVKMFDASSKFPVGVLDGNNYQLGNFDECLSIEVSLPKGTKRKKLNGQYCLAEIEYTPKNFHKYQSSEDNLFNTSVWTFLESFNLVRELGRRDVIYSAFCIPESCRPEDLKNAIEEILAGAEDLSEINFNIKVEEKLCQVKQDPLNFRVGLAHTALTGIVAIFVFLAVVSVFYDFESEDNGRLTRFLRCFSLKKNFDDFRKVDETKEIIPIHTLRFLGIVCVVMTHTLLRLIVTPTFNPGFMENKMQNSWLLGFSTGFLLLTVDSCFLIGGFLTGNKIINDLKSKKLKLFSNYLHRYIRLTPVYMLVVGFYATSFYQIGSGPLWKAKIGLEQERCLASWWTNLLYVNNYVNTDKICMVQAYYLACDFHYYLLAPPVVYLLWKKAWLGFTLIFALIIASATSLFSLTLKDDLDFTVIPFHSVLADVCSDPTYKSTYISSHTRLIPYVSGIVLSYFYYNYKSNFKLSPNQRRCSVIGGLITWLIPMLVIAFLYLSGYYYDRTENASYAVFHRILWSISSSWITFLAVTGNAGIFQSFLSWKALTPLSRLSYCAFLSHLIPIYSTLASSRTPEYITKMKVLLALIGDLQVTYFLAFILHILFEAPIVKLERTYITLGNNSKLGKGNEEKIDNRLKEKQF